MSDLKGPLFVHGTSDTDEEIDPVEEAIGALTEEAAATTAALDIVAALKTAASGPFEVSAKFGSELTEDERRQSNQSAYASRDGAVVLSSHMVERVVYRYAGVDDSGRPIHINGTYPPRERVVIKDVLLVFGVPAKSAYRALVDEAAAARSREWTLENKLREAEAGPGSNTVKKHAEEIAQHLETSMKAAALLAAANERVKQLEALLPKSMLADIDATLATTASTTTPTPTPTEGPAPAWPKLPGAVVHLGGRDPACKFHGPDDYATEQLCSCAGGARELCACGCTRREHNFNTHITKAGNNCSGSFPFSQAAIRASGGL